MNKRVAIIQSNYIPWIGYFNIIQCVDHFVLLDDVQFTRRDWRNRNLIKTKSGLKWLTIPVDVKGNFHIAIKDVYATDSDWRSDHWNRIVDGYRTAPYFDWIAPAIENFYLNSQEQNLSKINHHCISLVNSILKIETPIHWSMDFNSPTDKTERLVHICKALHATEYLSGPAAKNYLNVMLFQQEGIRVLWADYPNYPPYHQLHPPFTPHVSVIDLLFNEGPHAARLLKSKIWD